MAELIGPDSALVTYRPVIEISDSKKNEDGVTLKTAGSFGSTEFTADEIVTIYTYLGDFLRMKGLDPDAEAAANRVLDQSFLTGTNTNTYTN